MQQLSKLISAIFSIACVTVSAAQAGELRAELTPFEPLLGNWSCQGTNHATPDTPETKFEASFDFSDVLGGKWIRVAYSERTSDSHPIARDNIEYWGPSPGGMGYQTTFFNAFGQSETLAASGWSENAVTWEGTVTTPAGPAPFKVLVLLKQEDQSLVVEPALGLPDGNWFTIATLNCIRG